VALWQEGDRPMAMIAFERALRLAEPEAYIRRFLDYGQSVVSLLQEARRRNILPDYVAFLLAAAGSTSEGSIPGAVTLIEPLSEREKEVLRLAAAGLTNREIAQSLSISAETVKKHASAIFGKLGVANRTEAAAKARGLGLLD
jgi:LuxR family maltose regulon positive regulatory protein